MERLGRQLALQPHDLRGGVAAHLQGRLGELRRGVARVDRDVARGEDPVLALHPQVGSDQDAAALALRQAPARDGRALRATPAAHTVMSLGSFSPSASSTWSAVTSFDAGVQPDVDAALDQLDPGVLAQFRVERPEQRGRHLDQPDVHPGRVDVGEGGAEHGGAQLGERAGQLDAGGPAADHGDGQIAGVQLSRSKPAMRWSRSAIASVRVYRPKVCSAAPLMP